MRAERLQQDGDPVQLERQRLDQVVGDGRDLQRQRFQIYNSAAYLEGGLATSADAAGKCPWSKKPALLARELNRLAEEGGDL